KQWKQKQPNRAITFGAVKPSKFPDFPSVGSFFKAFPDPVQRLPPFGEAVSRVCAGWAQAEKSEKMLRSHKYWITY
ncbi:hypothetical protein, partial [uncultured Paracoccus sp.]